MPSNFGMSGRLAREPGLDVSIKLELQFFIESLRLHQFTEGTCAEILHFNTKLKVQRRLNYLAHLRSSIERLFGT